MHELEGLARRHMLEYFRLKKLNKQAKDARENAACGGACGGTSGGCFSGGCCIVNNLISQNDNLPSPNVPQGPTECPEQELDELRVTETYKMLIIPDNTLRDYLRSFDSNSLRKEFRTLAILIHPDKNQHPQGKVAFQKLYNAFIEVSQTNN